MYKKDESIFLNDVLGIVGRVVYLGTIVVLSIATISFAVALVGCPIGTIVFFSRAFDAMALPNHELTNTVGNDLLISIFLVLASIFLYQILRVLMFYYPDFFSSKRNESNKSPTVD